MKGNIDIEKSVSEDLKVLNKLKNMKLKGTPNESKLDNTFSNFRLTLYKIIKDYICANNYDIKVNDDKNNLVFVSYNVKKLDGNEIFKEKNLRDLINDMSFIFRKEETNLFHRYDRSLDENNNFIFNFCRIFESKKALNYLETITPNNYYEINNDSIYKLGIESDLTNVEGILNYFGDTKNTPKAFLEKLGFDVSSLKESKESEEEEI